MKPDGSFLAVFNLNEPSPLPSCIQKNRGSPFPGHIQVNWSPSPCSFLSFSHYVRNFYFLCNVYFLSQVFEKLWWRTDSLNLPLQLESLMDKINPCFVKAEFGYENSLKLGRIDIPSLRSVLPLVLLEKSIHLGWSKKLV